MSSLRAFACVYVYFTYRLQVMRDFSGSLFVVIDDGIDYSEIKNGMVRVVASARNVLYDAMVLLQSHAG